MNSAQIKYFLEAARHLNFTEAAKKLYITQPALSQQITALEAELNMQLFIREKNKLRLTPAAVVLVKELSEHEKQYNQIVEKARVANQGNNGMIAVGILQGQVLTENFQNALWDFRSQYPGVYIKLTVDSFHGLRDKLDSGELDIAYTTNFDIEDESLYLYEEVDENVGVAVVSIRHPLANEHITKLSQLKDETIVIIDADETIKVQAMIIEDCRRAGFTPKLALAENLNEQMLWIETGIGVGIINRDSTICYNPNVKQFEDLYIGINSFVVAKHRENSNPAAALFFNYIKSL